MKKNALFPQVNGLLHGGDYSPEQWLDCPEILQKDIELMKKANMNSVTLGVFSWSFYEPSEGEFHFEWLQEIMDRLYDHGIYTILATPSGARPSWLDQAYPEAMRVTAKGVRNRHGVRHNHCMSSPKYREKVGIIDRKLAERFGSHPGLLMWHISNELSGECFCPLCVERFRGYLEEKFDHDIEKLNHAWWTAFWSHRYGSFREIEPPFENGENSIMGLNLEWKRFTTWSMNDFMKHEIHVLKELTPDVPVTTNFMRLFDGLDYRRMADEVDVISWDSYPRFHNDSEPLWRTMADNAFQHAVMRSMKKDKPFMLMESAPGLVNWHPFNKLKRPGVHRLSCLQAVACGSDTVQYFQWRKGRGSSEQFHGAVVDHAGTDDTRVFREVKEVGELLQKLSPTAGTVVKAKAALLFDWDNRWAIQDMRALGRDSKKYEETCAGIWMEFLRLGIDMDVIASDADFTGYRVLVAPMLYLLQPQTAARLKAFVREGGQLLATYLTGYVDENQLCYLGGFPGDGLSELFGLVSEEIDTLYPGDRNAVKFSGDAGTGLGGLVCQVRDYAELLRVTDAEVLASYTEDFYQNTPAVTRKASGKGAATYVAARISPDQLQPLFRKLLADADISTVQLPETVERHVREGDGERYEFYLNSSQTAQEVKEVYGRELLSGAELQGTLKLPAYGTAVVCGRE